VAKIPSSPNYEWRLLTEFTLAEETGAEELARKGALVVVECAKKLNLPKARLVRLESAVKEAIANLCRRTSPDQPALPLELRVYAREEGVKARIEGANPASEGLTFERLTEALPSTSGWGFFLVEKMADAAQFMRQSNGDFEKFNGPRLHPEPLHHAVDVFLYVE
jgi:anti-sigma regulatory factor (Ser/Thr protein kinase)